MLQTETGKNRNETKMTFSCDHHNHYDDNVMIPNRVTQNNIDIVVCFVVWHCENGKKQI